MNKKTTFGVVFAVVIAAIATSPQAIQQFVLGIFDDMTPVKLLLIAAAVVVAAVVGRWAASKIRSDLRDS